MPTPVVSTNNYATLRVEGLVNLSAAGAVTSYAGDEITVAKNGTGLYDVTYGNAQEDKLYEVLGAGAHLIDTAVGTVKDVGVKAVPAQSATTGDMVMTFRTVNAAGADVDEASDALSVAFYFVVRVRRMTMPFT